MADYRLTPRALSDLDAIAEYSLGRWGRARTEKYLATLAARMDWLAASPELGSAGDEIAPGYRSFPEGQHLIFHMVFEGTISIIGLPHASMDLTNRLG